ncbi:MAG: flagellum-specific ATP synthase FliI, partial [Rhodospirillales bacterium]|nr:flagellum-specific ATP synthase FliI [Rhodospirillales bacterium]
AGSAPRRPLGAAMDLGVRALDIFTPLRAGQKIGIFAGAGTGKSSLLSMIARNNAADLTVLILLGEREIEIAHYVAALEENPRRIVVAESSGRPATARRLCLRTGLDIATHFAAEGMAVLVVIDSITRYFHALRDIALYQGELPAARGIPVSVFAEAARELERIGPARLDQPRGGAVTALIAVLTEGNNINDPISDFMRGVLDGHILLDRAIAEAGRYPAVDILKSISRSGLDGLGADQRRSVASARTLLLDFYEARELEKFGVAPDPKLIQAGRALESFLAQDMQSAPPAAASFAALAALLADPAAGA